MGSRRGSVHLGRANRTVLVTLVNLVLNLLVTRDRDTLSSRNGDLSLHLSNLEVCLAFLGLVYQEVLKLLQVDLDDAHGDLVAHIFVRILRDSLEKFISADRDDTSVGAVSKLRV